MHYLSHLVAARVARLTIGTVCGTDFDEADPEHVKRKDQCKRRPSGVLTVPGKFIPLVLKGTRLGEDDVSSRSVCREHQGSKPESEAAAYIVVYRGLQRRIQSGLTRNPVRVSSVFRLGSHSDAILAGRTLSDTLHDLGRHFRRGVCSSFWSPGRLLRAAIRYRPRVWEDGIQRLYPVAARGTPYSLHLLVL